MADLSRRDFLKIVSLTGSSAVIGCSSQSAQKLIPYIVPPEDIIPGKATWYATTCRECPAGCGMLAKNREGRVIKVEGNPLHPVNQGKLCARGQASLQGLYNPDRIREPLIKNAQGRFEPISWDKAEQLLVDKLQQIRNAGKGNQIVFLGSLMTGTLKNLINTWLGVLGSAEYMAYEPMAHEPLRAANRIVFGYEDIPAYCIDKSDFLISFGADFLETWLSPVEYSRQFAAFHCPRDLEKNAFICVNPRLSLTAANADHWLCVPPGTEYLVALGMMRIILDENLCKALPPEHKKILAAVVKDISIQSVMEKTGINRELLHTLAKKFSASQRPLALAGSMIDNPTEAAVAANLLCSLMPGTAEVIDLQKQPAIGEAVRAEQMKQLSDRMRTQEVALLFINQANPVYSLPQSWGFKESMAAVPFVVSFSSTLDETSEHAHLILPTHTPLESWDDYSPRKNVTGFSQPVMGTMFNTRHLGDVMLSTGKKLFGTAQFPWNDFYALMRYTWEKQKDSSNEQTFWNETLKKGGVWETTNVNSSSLPFTFSGFSFPAATITARVSDSLHFITYPTIQFFDGRDANRPWLQEMPDPITQITWGGWIEIHPETAVKFNIKKGDVLKIQTPHGAVEAPAYLFHGISPNTLAMPLGSGHTAYGRFTSAANSNPMQLLSSKLDTVSGGLIWTEPEIVIQKQGTFMKIASTDGSLSQQGRNLAQAIFWDSGTRSNTAGNKPHLRLPLPEGYDPEIDFYPSHPHKDYRWCMVIDLDRCIGCGACVVACYAENNVAVVEKEQVIKEREMSWLRIQRYFEQEGAPVRFLPMLCQHCDSAPCESVCPVYAPHHSTEGLNNQIYNRCIGTRFCSQNCPYKVRRFNYFTYTRPEPLNWQLNPDVTVRQKGVMEKCSFCVQRIKEAKLLAKDQGRKVKDGEVIPACVQTCPAEALVFGNLLDRESRVSKLINDYRAYQVLGHLNTKPAVIYLKKIINTLKA